MARILVTGSTTGLGLAASVELLDAGHDVVLHARDAERARSLVKVVDRAAGVVVGDLAEPDEVADLAAQVNDHGRLDAVIHNAGVYVTAQRSANSRGHPLVLAVNVLAPYVLTALVHRPARLIYLSSGMHTGGRTDLDDIAWTSRRWNGTQAYCDSKLLVTALAFAVARRWPEVRSNAVDPGWVPTRMGGSDAPDDLTLGHRTQVWLAASDDEGADVSGRYWYHQRQRPAARATMDVAFQDGLIDRLQQITGVPLA